MGKTKAQSKSFVAEAGGCSPFPSFARPFPEECFAATIALAKLHGLPSRENDIKPVLDSLIRTILSQNTTDKNSRVAFAKMKERFPTWRSVLSANDAEVEDSIRFGGLAETKVRYISSLARRLVDC
jgi:endonuclease-3